MRRIASAISGAIVSCRMLCDTRTASVATMLSVSTSFLIGEAATRATAPPDKHPVRDVGIDAFGAAVDQRLGGVAQRAGAVDDVVDQDAAAAGDIADDVHDLGHPGALAALVDDRQIGIDPAGDLAGAKDARRHRATR